MLPLCRFLGFFSGDDCWDVVAGLKRVRVVVFERLGTLEEDTALGTTWPSTNHLKEQRSGKLI